MDYKAIIFDIDGTVIPNRKDGMPSEHLIQTIGNIQNQIIVSCATGRPLDLCRHIIKALNLQHPCIVSGGSQIIDPVTEEVLWEKSLNPEQIDAITAVIKSINYKIDGLSTKTITAILGVSPAEVSMLISQLNEIVEVQAHPVPSWTTGHFDIHITHKDATKRHVLEIWKQMMHLDAKDIVGFGDGDNDIPIFEGVGYKVAMGNATEKLKAAADEITKNVEEDGVAIIIEKLFIK